MQSFQRWVRVNLIGDLSYAATFVTILALGFHFAGQMAAAAAFGVLGAGLVILKYRAKRRTAQNR